MALALLKLAPLGVPPRQGALGGASAARSARRLFTAATASCGARPLALTSGGGASWQGRAQEGESEWRPQLSSGTGATLSYALPSCTRELLTLKPGPAHLRLRGSCCCRGLQGSLPRSRVLCELNQSMGPEREVRSSAGAESATSTGVCCVCQHDRALWSPLRAWPRGGQKCPGPSCLPQ